MQCFWFLTQVYNVISDTLWVEITVESEMTMALVEQLAALPFPSNRLDESIPQVIHMFLVIHTYTFYFFISNYKMLSVQQHFCKYKLSEM